MLQVTAIYAGVLGVMLILLSVRVARRRVSTRIGIGDGEDATLRRAIRVQANFIEYVPLTLLLIGIAELNGAATLTLHAMGAALLVGRLLHAFGLSRSAGTGPPRAIGMALTWAALLAGALASLYYALT